MAAQPDSISRALARVWSDDSEPGGVATGEAERRNGVRRDGRGDVSVATVQTPLPDGIRPHCGWLTEHGTAGRLVDLSTSGVSLLFVKPVEINTAILVRLASRDHSHPVDVAAHVVRAVELPNGEWKIVAQFDQPLCFDLAFQLTQASGLE
ncbi:MAG TPA: PilZ domain-containing protein [Planctomycetaceae bacterium]|nr:PilZ domain-containing protein [Planctomycetaceae bacterium]